MRQALLVGVIGMAATPESAASKLTVLHPAGTILQDDYVHVVERTFSGALALCGAGSITRPLRLAFENVGRGACEQCEQLLAEAGSSPQSRGPIVL